MRLSSLTAALLPSTILAETLRTVLGNNAEMAAWHALIRPYEGVIQNLMENNDVTILVPSNDATNEFMDSPAFQSLTPDSLKQLLRYMVIRGKYFYVDLPTAGPFLKTFLDQPGLSGGQRIQVSSGFGAHSYEDQPVALYSGMGQKSSVDTTSFEADSTPVLLIDKVFTIPLSLSETCLAAGLTSLAGAIQTVNTNLDSVQDATFFAPTNEAFEAVGSALNSASDSDLQNILQYHYLTSSGSPLYTSDISSAKHQTAEGKDVTLSYTSSDELFVNSAAVTYANLLVSNGVAQIIDQVLNPNSNTTTTPAGSIGLPEFSDATRTSSPPFANAVAGAQAPAGVKLGSGPAVTPLGPLAPGYKEQQKEINAGSSIRLQGMSGVLATIMLTATCGILLF